MKRFDFPLWADTAFYAVCTFAISFCILRYYRMPVGLSFLVATCFALAVFGAVFLLLSGKHRKKILSKQEREEKEKLLLHFALEKQERVRSALIEAYTADGKKAHCQGDDLYIDGKTAVPFFSMEPLTADNIALLIRKFGAEFSLICNSVSEEGKKLLASFSIPAQTGDEVYSLFTRTNTTPSPLILGNVPRRTVKQKLRTALLKRNARPFFASGLLVLFMSLFVIFPLYYIIAGSVLLACAVTVRFFGYEG